MILYLLVSNVLMLKELWDYRESVCFSTTVVPSIKMH